MQHKQFAIEHRLAFVRLLGLHNYMYVGLHVCVHKNSDLPAIPLYGLMGLYRPIARL